MIYNIHNDIKEILLSKYCKAILRLHFYFIFQDGYSSYALFFHDTYGGTVIGVLLKPAIFECKDFKVADTNCRKLNDDGKLSFNVSAMIEDFYVLGRGIIRAIDIPNKKFSLTS